MLLLAGGGFALSFTSVMVAARYIKNLFRRRDAAPTPV
jgi:hypothetical protein